MIELALTILAFIFLLYVAWIALIVIIGILLFIWSALNGG